MANREIDLMDTDGDDPVVFEIPVFLSQELAETIHLLQYPLRPPDRPYDSDLGALSGVRMKPNHKKLEFTYDLDTQSTNFDSQSEHRMTKSLMTSRLIPPKTNYAVGMFREGQLHLTPLNSILQIRPELPHIDTEEQQRKQAAQQQAALEAGLAPKEERKDPKQIAVHIKKQETERAAEMRKASHGYLNAQMEQEKWVPIAVAPRQSFEAQMQFERLICQSGEQVEFPYEPVQYLDSILPVVQETPKKSVSMNVDDSR
eukprot:TRINITY_DN4034_c0_g1_i1.p1 TRINITY_DN4034_c0_g1~~TRINITY_DN4034_c0_g1_i1.p1  ORF type:complete len:258 (+),score=64.99 TRINITY_DN4034_c0_g1_i1:61-834(+)